MIYDGPNNAELAPGWVLNPVIGVIGVVSGPSNSHATTVVAASTELELRVWLTANPDRASKMATAWNYTGAGWVEVDIRVLVEA